MDVLSEMKDAADICKGDGYFGSYHAMMDARELVRELIEGAEDARSALFSCIDALSSEEDSDHEALARITDILNQVKE